MKTELNRQPRTARPLKIYRTASCLSQAELAALAGLARSTIIRLEAGDPPSRRTANAVAAVLGRSPAALFPRLTQMGVTDAAGA